MKNALVLCSGGLDSVTTAHHAKKNMRYDSISLLFFNYGQRNINEELNASKNCAQELKVKFFQIDIPWLKGVSTSLLNSEESPRKVNRKELKDTKQESSSWYVPCRNLIFLSYALALAESLKIKEDKTYDILVGFKEEGLESFPDASKDFITALNKLSSISTKGRFRIIAPLIKKDKEDIVKLAVELNVDLRKTFSCYVGGGDHCGCCLACRIRQEGFYWAGIVDPTEYKEKMKDFRLAK